MPKKKEICQFKNQKHTDRKMIKLNYEIKQSRVACLWKIKKTIQTIWNSDDW